MKKNFVPVIIAAFLVSSYSYAAQSDQQKASSAQSAARADAKSQAEARTRRGEVTVDAGSQIQAETVSNLDLKKAKPGDSFKMKTTRAVKRDGKEIISKGSTITAHLEQITRADNTMTGTIVFDRIEDRKTRATASLSAVVTAVVRSARVEPEMTTDTMAPPPPPRRQQRQSAGGGGLVGGVVDTVGGVTGQVSSTVDSTVRGATGVDTGGRKTGNSVGLVPGTIQIVTEATGTATSGSTLALSDRSPRIESGTKFMLETTSALTLKQRSKGNQ